MKVNKLEKGDFGQAKCFHAYRCSLHGGSSLKHKQEFPYLVWENKTGTNGEKVIKGNMIRFPPYTLLYHQIFMILCFLNAPCCWIFWRTEEAPDAEKNGNAVRKK